MIRTRQVQMGMYVGDWVRLRVRNVLCVLEGNFEGGMDSLMART